MATVCSCGKDNPDGAKFCLECGAPITRACVTCGTSLPSDAKFCLECGTPVGAAATPSRKGIRKVVTVVFVDLAGSTSLQEHMDPESVRRVMDRFYATMRSEIEAAGGVVVKFTGDGVMAGFGIREAREDDALRAIRAAYAMRESFAEFAEGVSVERSATVSLRVGINTGEVVVADEDDDVVGDVVNVAARLEHAAGDGNILVGEETWKLARHALTFEPVEPLELKGKAEPVPAYRVASLQPPAADEAAAPFVGRSAELGRLRAAFDDCVATKTPIRVIIVGSPGLGKTRLATELAATVGDRAHLLEARCDPAGTATYAPIVDAIRDVAAVPDTATADEVVAAIEALLPDSFPEGRRVATLVASLFGIGDAAAPQETFWAVRRLLEAMAEERAVVLVIDDVHWAEPMLLDLVDHIVEWSKDAAVMIVALARPEIRDVRPSLVDAGAIVLEGLDPSDTAELAAGLLGAHDLPTDLVRKILDTTEGNPLFVRELLRMLVDDGVLSRIDDRWIVTADEVDVPPTIHALLSARIERLRDDERAVVERASVVGKEFYRGAVLELVPPAVRSGIDTHLETLRRKELVEPEGTYWIDERVFRFHHVLIRDAAYRRLLKEARAELHERFADWLENKVGDLVGEHEEVLGYHLEQAYDYLKELGPLADHAIDLGRRAAAHLASAARRALDRDDLAAAANLSGRALNLTDDEDVRASILLDRCEAVLATGDVASAKESVSELRLRAPDARLRAWADCFDGQLAILTDPSRLHDVAQLVDEAATRLTDLGDSAGAAKAYAVHAQALAHLGRFGACEAALDRALASARAAGDRRRANAVLASAPVAALWGPNPVPRASGRCLDVVRVLRITAGAPAVEATALRCQAVLEAMRGRSEAAHRMLASARKTLEELGLRHALVECEMFAGLIDLLSRDPASAEASLRSAYDGFRALNVGTDVAHAAALLARALVEQAKDDEAFALTEESERLGGDDLQTGIAWRCVRARVLGRRRAFDEALALARAAVDLAEPTDALVDHADARLALSEVLAAAGRKDEAATEARKGAELYRRKEAASSAPAPVPSAPRAASPATSNASRRSGVRVAPPRDEALAALTGSGPRIEGGVGCAAGVTAPTALEGYREWRRAMLDRDWDAIRRLLADDYVFVDHRSGLRFEASRESVIESWRETWGTVDHDWDIEVIATWPFELSLAKVRSFSDDWVRHTLVVNHWVGSIGRRAEQFDENDFDTAFNRMDELAYEVSPAKSVIDEYVERYNTRDWDGLRAVFADDLVVADHREPKLLEASNADEWVEALKGGVVASPDFTVRVIPITASGTAALIRARNTGHGQSDGGEVLVESLAVLDTRGGLVTRVELFGHDDELGARARLHELDSHPSFARWLVQRFFDAYNARDWDGVLACWAPDVHLDDHRPLGWGSFTGRTRWLAHLQEGARAAPDAQLRITDWLALTPGSALVNFSMSGTTADGGEFEIDRLMLARIEDGSWNHAEGWDSSQLGEALEAISAADRLSRLMSGYQKMFNTRAWHRVHEWYNEDYFILDRRPAAFGTRNVDEWIEGMRVLIDLAPNVRVSVTQLHSTPDAEVAIAHFRGDLKDGGGFSLDIGAASRVVDGRFAKSLTFDPADVDSATRWATDPSVSDDQDTFEELRRSIRSSDAGSHLLTAGYARFAEAFRSGDLQMIADLHAPNVRSVDHINGVTLDHAGIVDWNRHVFAQHEGMDLSWEPVVVLGARHGVIRCRLAARATADGAGAHELVWHLAQRVDGSGRVVHEEVYGPDDAVRALVRAEEMFIEDEALGEAGDGARRRVHLWRCLQAFDVDDEAHVSFLDPDFTSVDHRSATFGTTHGREAWLERERSLSASSQARKTTIHVLEHNDDAVVYDGVVTVQDTYGGDVELAYVVVATLGDAGVRRMEIHPPEQREEAVARFRELTAESDLLSLANAATRAWDRTGDYWVTPEWRRLVGEVWSNDLVADVRRGLARYQSVGRDEILANLEEVHRVWPERPIGQPIAVRGEGLALLNILWSGTDPEGVSSELEYLGVVELDDAGLITRFVTFDLDDMSAAFNELTARYIAGDARAFAGFVEFGLAVREARNTRDLATLESLVAADFVLVDHRPASFGTIEGRDAILRYHEVSVDLSADMHSAAVKMLGLANNASLSWHRSVGTTGEAAAYEVSYLNLWTARDGLSTRVEIFPLDQIDEALRRFRELATEDDEASNAAVRAWVRRRLPPDARDDALDDLQQRSLATNDAVEVVTSAAEAFERAVRFLKAGDWDRYGACFAEDYVMDERRAGLRSLASGRQAAIGTLEHVGNIADLTIESEVVATRGDRLELRRIRFIGADNSGGAFDVSTLQVQEIDATGLIAATVIFDPEDLDAGVHELTDRAIEHYGAHCEEPLRVSQTYADHLNRRDWDAVATVLAPDITLIDHRPVSWGTLEGRPAVIEMLRSLRDIVPDIYLIAESVDAVDEHGLVGIIHAYGATPEGGLFTIRFYGTVIVTNGVYAHLELFPLEQRDEAVARFHELTQDGLSNLATRAGDALAGLYDADDWRQQCARALHEDFELDVRRSLARYKLRGREAYLDNIESLQRNWSNKPVSRTIAVRGDLLALSKLTLTGTDEAGSYSELEYLAVQEVDEAGTLTALITFDTDDAAAAFAELDERYLVGEGTPFADVLRVSHRHMQRLNARDWDALLEVQHPDKVTVDHRPAGWGRLEGADAWLEMIRSLWDNVPSIGVRKIEVGAMTSVGQAAFMRATGRTPEDTPFEMQFWAVGIVRDGLSYREELFAEDQRDAAIARLHELSRSREQDALTNVAARAWERVWSQAWTTEDWDRIGAVFSDGVVLEARRAAAQYGHVGRDAMIENLKIFRANGNVTDPPGLKVLAIRGDRLALIESAYAGTTIAGTLWDATILTIVETDDEGRIAALITFDDTDSIAAYEELSERHAASRGEDAPENPPNAFAVVQNLAEALHRRDWERYDALYTDDVRWDDRRALVGLEHPATREQFLANMRHVVERTNYMPVDGRVLATRGESLILIETAWRGTTESGGRIVQDLVELYAVRDGQVAFVMTCEVHDADTAWRELDERYAATLLPSEARVWRRICEWIAAANARDWDRFERTMASDFEMVDRRPLVGDEPVDSRAYVDGCQSITHDAPDARWRVRSSYVARRGLVASCAVEGTTAAGGPIELAWHAVLVVHEGKIARHEAFDDEGEARTRFDDLTCTMIERLSRRTHDLMNRRDIDGIAQALDPAYTSHDHMYRYDMDKDECLEWMRMLMASETASFAMTPVVWLGDRHAVLRQDWTTGEAVTRAVGQATAELCVATRCSPDGRYTRENYFGPTDLFAAVLRGEEMYVEDEATGDEAAASRRRWALWRAGVAYNAGDWDALRACLAPDLVTIDHRPAGWGRLEGRDAWLDTIKSLASIAPDRAWQLKSFEFTASTVLAEIDVVGTDEHGGFFVLPFVGVVFLDDRGWARQELFDTDQRDAAIARYRELAEITPFEATYRRWVEAFYSGAGEDFAALYNPAYVLRENHHTELDLVTHLRVMRGQSRAPNSVAEVDIVLTLGDRNGVLRMLLASDDRYGGRVDVPMAVATRLDEQGRFLESDSFFPEGIYQALARAEEMHREDEADDDSVVGSRRREILWRNLDAHQSSDFETLAGTYTPDLEVIDHRNAGFGTVLGRDAWLTIIRSLTDVASERTTRLDEVIRYGNSAVLYQATVVGRDEQGSDFELPYIVLAQLCDNGICGAELFAPEDVELARSRFSEAGVVSNDTSAQRAWNRFLRRFEAGDWGSIEATLADDYVMDDRTNNVLLDRSSHIRNLREIGEPGDARWHVESAVWLGDRHTVTTTSWVSEGDDVIGPSRATYHAVIEMTVDGRVGRITTFPEVDLLGAITLAEERYRENEATGDDATSSDTRLRFWRALRALNERDWETYASLIDEDALTIDHRPAGWGTLRGRDAFIEHRRRLDEVVREQSLRITSINIAGDALLLGIETRGQTNGGGSFVMPTFTAMLLTPGRARQEIFPPERRGDAERRFNELILATSEVSKTPAAILGERFLAASSSRDHDAMAALIGPGFICVNHVDHVTFDERQLADAWRSNFSGFGQQFQIDVILDLGERHRLTDLKTEAIAGDNAAEGWNDVAAAHSRYLCVTRADEEARFARLDLFREDALLDAVARLEGFYLEDEATGPAADGSRRRQHVWRCFQAYNARDFETQAACFTADLRAVDHSPLGHGTTVGRDRWMAGVTELAHSTPDQHYVLDAVHEVNDRGVLISGSIRGSVPAGGAFELPYVQICVTGDYGIYRTEIFDPSQLADARVRFREVTATPGGVRLAPGVPDGPWRLAWTKWRDSFLARDWERFGSTLHDEVRVLDHRSIARMGAELPHVVTREWLADVTRADLGPRTVDWEVDILAARPPRWSLARQRRFGPGDEGEGPWELSSLAVLEHDEETAECVAVAYFDDNDVNAALALLDEWTISTTSLERFFEDLVTAVNSNDVEKLGLLHAPDLVIIDHLYHLKYGIEEHLENIRQATAPPNGARASWETFVSLGDRHGLVLLRNSWPDGSESVWAIAARVDDAGHALRGELFEPDAILMALARADELYLEDEATGEAAECARRRLHVWRAMPKQNEGDWEGYAEALDPDLVSIDHRPVGWGEILGAEAFIEHRRRLVDIAPNEVTVRSVRIAGDVTMIDITASGRNAEGGTFEIPYVGIAVIGDRGVVRQEYFAPEQRNLAERRFRELAAEPPR